jgi:predicted Zn finger-like uncharacterized protein
MDVRCPQCDTLYEVDARRLRGGATTLKCSQCEHVFRMQTHAALIQENQRRWMVRSVQSGDIRYFLRFDELHQWILRGTVDKRDEISRTGKRWKRLSAIGEFMPIFQAVESIMSISASQESVPRPAAASRPRMQTSQQFGTHHTGPMAASGRSHTPMPSKARPMPPSPNAPGSAEPGASQPTRADEPPRTQIQTGAFGAAGAADTSRQGSEDEDDWSFGDMPLGVAEGHGFGAPDRESSGLQRGAAGHPAQETPGQEISGHYSGVYGAQGKSSARRWPVVALVIVLVLASGSALLYMTRPRLIAPILGIELSEVGETTELVALAESDPIKKPDAPDSPRQYLEAAIVQATNAAQKAQSERLLAAVGAARPELAASLKRAADKAREAAREPDLDEILASANRYLRSGNPERARKKFHKVLAKERANVPAITGLAWSLLAVGRTSAAATQFHKAIAFDPGYGDAYIGLGKAERVMGNQEAALKAYQTYLGKFPTGPKASIARYQAEKLKRQLGR